MSTTLLESRKWGIWVGTQADEDTPASTPDKRLEMVSGDVTTKREMGSENYADGQRFSSSQDYLNTLSGDGAPVFEGQAGPLALGAASILGDQDVVEVDTGSGLYENTIKEGLSDISLTIWKTLGEDVGPIKEKSSKCRVGSFRVEASSANKVSKGTLQVVSLDPGEVYDTDPVLGVDPDDALLHTEGKGRFKIDGEAYEGTSQWAVVITDPVTLRYGDSVRPHAVGKGIAQVALEGVTIGLDDAGLAKYNEQVYGMPEPPAGTKPIENLPGLGSFEADLRKGSQQRVTITGTPTGGDFPLTIGSRTVSEVPYNATPAQVQAKLEELVGRSRVVCSGTALPGGSVKVVFTDPQPKMTTSSAELSGGTDPTVAVTDDGHWRGFKVVTPAVRWSPDIAITGNVEGGPTEIALGGQVRRLPGEDIIVITARTGDSAAY